MRQDEFIEVHGAEAWKCLVAPLKLIWCRCDECAVIRQNANILVHADLIHGKSGIVPNPHDPERPYNGR